MQKGSNQLVNDVRFQPTPVQVKDTLFIKFIVVKHILSTTDIIQAAH